MGATMPDHEFSIEGWDTPKNMLVARMVTRLNEQEQSRFRELLSDAWEDGYDAGRDWDYVKKANPFRVPADTEGDR